MANSTSLTQKIQAEKAKIAAAQKRVNDLKRKELQRIAKLAESAGVMDVEISDEQYLAAFRSLVSQVSETPSKPESAVAQIGQAAQAANSGATPSPA